MSKRELRVSAVPRTLELRQNSDGTRSIFGEAVVYNTLSEDLGGFRERIAPGAFRNSLRETEVMALYSHDEADILGRQSSGTLTVTDGPDALRFVCKLPNTTVGNDVAELCARGDLKGMSFGFSCVQDQWTTGADGSVIRTVLEAMLYEVSVVGSPAYLTSTVSLRSCPASLRSKLTQRSDDASDWTDPDPYADPDDDPDDPMSGAVNVPDDEDETETCSCRCERCLNNRCERCIRSECSDAVCYDRGCAMPGQDENRSDYQRIAQHFNSAHLNLYR
jgi:HK97 family phage prohead protease